MNNQNDISILDNLTINFSKFRLWNLTIVEINQIIDVLITKTTQIKFYQLFFFRLKFKIIFLFSEKWIYLALFMCDHWNENEKKGNNKRKDVKKKILVLLKRFKFKILLLTIFLNFFFLFFHYFPLFWLSTRYIYFIHHFFFSLFSSIILL